MERSEFKKSFIEKIELNCDNTVEKGEDFCRSILDKYYPDTDYIYIDGSGDGGIDCFWVDSNEDSKCFYVIQSKYGKSYDGKNTISEFTKIKYNLKNPEFHGKEGCFDNLREFIKNNTGSYSIKFVLLTCDDINDSEFDFLNMIGEDFSKEFGISCNCDNISLDTIYRDDTGESKKDIELELSGLFASKTGESIGLVNVIDYVKFLENYISEYKNLSLLFSCNFRYYLGSNVVNKKISETLRNDPKHFSGSNNGVTIFADSFTIEEGGKIRLKNPTVPNGCQTTNTCYHDIHFGGIESSDAMIRVYIRDVGSESIEKRLEMAKNLNTQTTNKASNFIGRDEKAEEIKKHLESKDYHVSLVQGDLVNLDLLSKKDIKENSVEFVDLLGIITDIDGFPGVAHSRKYNTSKEFSMIDSMILDKTFSEIVYLLSLVKKSISKRDSIYNITQGSHLQICVLYQIIKKSLLESGISSESDKFNNTFLEILLRDDLKEYFIKEANIIVKKYIDPDNSRNIFIDYSEHKNNLNTILKKIAYYSSTEITKDGSRIKENAKNLREAVSDWAYRDLSKKIKSEIKSM